MKRVTIWLIVGLVLVATIAIAGAAGPDRGGWRAHRWGHFGPGSYLAHQLNLSNGQRDQIKMIWQVERPTVAQLVREVAAEAAEMDAATAQGKADQEKVEEIAARQGVSIAKLLIEKEKLKSEIYTSVLDRGQRTKADELQQRWDKRLDRIADRLEK